MRQAIDEAGADRIGDLPNTIGTVRVACNNGARSRCRGQMTSGASATIPPHICAVVGITRPPAIVDPYVAAVGPTQLLWPPHELLRAGDYARVVEACARDD